MKRRISDKISRHVGMKNVARHTLTATLACSMLLAGCSKEKEFRISGNVEGAEGSSLILEKSDFHGRWIAVDSTKVGSSGKFSIEAPSPASPEIYRLSLGDRFIYFPVDSVESLTVTTTEKGFGHDYTLAGTPGAERLAAFEKDLLSLQSPDSASLADFKRSVYSKYIKESRGSIIAYYVLTKFYDGKPLYDPADKEDVKYYAAVATQFDQYNPGDPHGQMVKEVSLAAMRAKNKAAGKHKVIQADELRVIDIDLPDENGKRVKLSDIVGKGKRVAVIFSQMNERESPLFNRELAKIYNSRNGAVEFYHVSFDAGQYEWREATKNLPWITVLDPQGTASTALSDYNVTGLPAVFIYDGAGDLVERPESLEDLAKKL